MVVVTQNPIRQSIIDVGYEIRQVTSGFCGVVLHLHARPLGFFQICNLQVFLIEVLCRKTEELPRGVGLSK